MTSWRVTPGRIPASSGGVITIPSLTTNTFAVAPSATSPVSLSRIGSKAARACASCAAMRLLSRLQDLIPGSTARGWLRRTAERMTGTPSRWYSAGRGTSGLTRMTTVGPWTRSSR